MSDKSLQVIPDVSGTAIETYGNREVVKELVQRLISFHPAAKQVGQAGMMAAAQLAILMGASPLPGLNEIHIWEKDGKINVGPGINYWRRRSEAKGGIFYRISPRPMTEPERVLYDIPQGIPAAICSGIRVSDMERFLKMGLTPNLVFESVEYGIGTGTVNEYAKKGRPIIWSAIKRAETDLLKKLFPYVPGEGLTAGAGMKLDTDGTYTIDHESKHWGALDLSLDEAPEIINGEFDHSIDDTNDELFYGDSGSQSEKPTADPPQKPQNGNATFPAIRQRLKLSGSRVTVSAICKAVTETGLYKNTPHVTNAIKKYDGFPNEYPVNDITGDTVFKVDSALAVFDWLINRKADAAKKE